MNIQTRKWFCSWRPFVLPLLIGIGAMALTGCGKKAAPQSPEPASYSYPGQYPPEE